MLSIAQKQFVLQYKKILTGLQKVGGKIIILVLLGIILSYLLQSIKPINQIQQNRQEVQISIIKKSIEKYLSIDNIKDVQIDIHAGNISKSGDTLQSTNNLIIFKGFVLPKNSTIFSLSSIKDKDYFLKNTYDPDDLRLQIMALINGSSNSTTSQRMNMLDISGSNLHETFGLNCMDTNITSPICSKYIDEFLNTFYTFNIIDFDKELAQIADALVKKRQKSAFCQNILYYTQYTDNFSDSIQQALRICDDDILSTYKKLKYFNTINNEFNTNVYQNTVYDIPELNSYKLISFMQSIFIDVQSDNLNARRIQGYISYLQSLMRKPMIDKIYRDMSYWFINKYLVPYMQQNSSINQKYPGLSNELLGLNKESILQQNSGLQNMIYNTGLIETIQNNIQTNTQSIESLVQGLNILPYMTITSKSIDNQTITITGYLTIIHPIQGNITTDFSTALSSINNRLIVQNISLPEYSLFTEVLDAFVKSRNTTFPALYNYINENVALYSRQTGEQICEQLKSLTTFSINICNASIIQGTFQQTDTVSIDYKIQIQANSIVGIQTSDTALTTYLNDQYKGAISDPIRLPALVREIILSQPEPQDNKDTTENANIIRIAEKFQTFFKVKPSDIVLFQDTYYIEFTAHSITFIIAYNEQENITGPLYFRDISINGQPLRLNKRSVKLETNSTQAINTFMIDPLKYIEQNDPFIYESYLQFK